MNASYIQVALADLQDRLPKCEPELLDLYLSLVFTTGSATTLENVHDAWSIWKNRIRPDHWSLIPFDELSADVQVKDQKYVDAIVAVARGLGR